MSDPIELETVPPENIMRSALNPEQVQSFISIISGANPELITLPSDKSFTDIKRFIVKAFPSGNGMVNIVFR